VVLHLFNGDILYFKGLEFTKNGHFGGGNTAWEEKNLLSYANSEVRFVEIYDSLCNDASQDQDTVKLIEIMILDQLDLFVIFLVLLFCE